jgi:hypothetical protein
MGEHLGRKPTRVALLLRYACSKALQFVFELG